ncbi:MAG: 1-acyl-sn-glycerol-3-phosphate acyltransferase [Bdellovibrionales bacterium]|nr:1-acyl-sn-glycerol-3-phosphate acyltransferase [Bdellovibrionales bacterium]
MIFSLLRRVVSFLIQQFYSRISLEGAPPQESGPLLVVSNHPNFLLDPLVLLSSFRRNLWFLAKSTLFRPPFRRILDALHLIPIYRRQDNPEDVTKNEQSFQRVLEHFEKQRAVLIFPEGKSMGERKLYPMKTGAARMALQYASEHSFSSSLCIQPVGLTYSDFERFRSAVTLSFAEPIVIDDYQARYYENSQDAVRDLTSEIDRSLRSVTIEIENSEHEELIDEVAQLYASQSVSVENDRERYQLIVENIRALGESFPAQRRRFESRIHQYSEFCEALSLTPEETPGGSADTLFLLLNLPFLLLGAITHYPIYRLIGFLVHRNSVDPLTRGSFKLVLGTALYSLLYLCVFFFLWVSGGKILFALLGSLCVAWSGYSVNNYLQEARFLLLSWLWPGRAHPVRMLHLVRDELIRELDELRII